MKRALEAFWRDLLADLRSVRYAAAALGRNLMAGLRLALFLPVSRLAFRIDAVQLLLLFMLLCLIDIGGDRLRFAGDASFNLLGAGNELAGIALLAAMAVVAAVLFRKPGMTIALLVTALAALPIVQSSTTYPTSSCPIRPALPARSWSTMAYWPGKWPSWCASRRCRSNGRPCNAGGARVSVDSCWRCRWRCRPGWWTTYPGIAPTTDRSRKAP